MCIRDRHIPLVFTAKFSSVWLYLWVTGVECKHSIFITSVSYTHLTEELKACDPMRWVGLMNTLTAQIEEILIRELICS